MTGSGRWHGLVGALGVRRGRRPIAGPFVFVLAALPLTASACSHGSSPSSQGSGSTRTTSPAQSSTSTSHVSAESSSTSTSVAPGGQAGPLPTLGVSTAWGASAIGFGQVKPAEISLGGDPTGMLTGITWQSWGGNTATGSGTGTYVGPNQSVAQGTQEKAIVVASDPGTCGGKPAYQQVKWYFPQHGETLSTGANNTIDACTGP